MSILDFREQVLKEWKEHDPYLKDVEAFREFFNEQFHKRLVEEERAAKKQINLLATEIMRPVIVFPSAWAQDNPDWLLKRIRLDRLAQLMKGVEGEATDSEALYYMAPRSLEAPMDYDWSQIYIYLTMTVMGEEKFKGSGIAMPELTDWQKRLLKDLRKWIYERSMRTLKEKERHDRS